VQHCWKCKRELRQALPGQSTIASRAHLCMLRYSLNTSALNCYMCPPSYEGRRHVRHCQECVQLAPVLDLVELIVVFLCIPDSAVHARGLCSLVKTCNGYVQLYLRSTEACKGVRDWHQCFDLVDLIVVLLCIPDSAAHVRGLRNLIETCNNQLGPYLRSIGACASVHDWHQCFGPGRACCHSLLHFQQCCTHPRF
jgi:hypothetical protein